MVILFATVVIVASFRDDSILHQYEIEQEDKNAEKVTFDNWYPKFALVTKFLDTELLKFNAIFHY